MSSVAESCEKLTQRFCEWTKERVDIRAGAVIGSRARLDHPAGEWADLDMVIVTRIQNLTGQQLTGSMNWANHY